jgi:hypothetical protein
MINEETGEVVGEVEDRFRIQEDPVLYERGHENDPVFIEIPDEAGLREGDANALAAFARIVPPDQQDWITKSATIVRHVISSIRSTRTPFSNLGLSSPAMRSRLRRTYWSRRSRPLRATTSQNRIPLHIILQPT